MEATAKTVSLASDLTGVVLSIRETAAMLRTTPGTLAQWRCLGIQPLRYKKIGKKVVYLLSDVLEFINSRPYGNVDPDEVAKRRRTKRNKMAFSHLMISGDSGK